MQISPVLSERYTSINKGRKSEPMNTEIPFSSLVQPGTTQVKDAEKVPVSAEDIRRKYDLDQMNFYDFNNLYNELIDNKVIPYPSKEADEIGKVMMMIHFKTIWLPSLGYNNANKYGFEGPETKVNILEAVDNIAKEEANLGNMWMVNQCNDVSNWLADFFN